MRWRMMRAPIHCLVQIASSCSGCRSRSWPRDPAGGSGAPQRGSCFGSVHPRQSDDCRSAQGLVRTVELSDQGWKGGGGFGPCGQFQQPAAQSGVQLFVVELLDQCVNVVGGMSPQRPETVFLSLRLVAAHHPNRRVDPCAMPSRSSRTASGAGTPPAGFSGY